MKESYDRESATHTGPESLRSRSDWLPRIVIQRDAWRSWFSTNTLAKRGVTNAGQDHSVLDKAFALIEAFWDSGIRQG